MTRTIRPTFATILAGFFFGAAGVVVAQSFDTPNSGVNPVTGNIEIADPVWSGTSRDIHYVIDPGDGGTAEVFVVTDHPLDDLRPKLTIDAGGNAWVAWWRDDVVDRVFVRKRNGMDGSWGVERLHSDLQESSRRPVLAHDGTRSWVAYEVDLQGQTGIAVALIIDEPDPIGIRLLLCQTAYSGPKELAIRAESGHLWITWVDSSTEVGWVEYDATEESWSLPAYDSYVNDTTLAARARIRSAVLGAP